MSYRSEDPRYDDNDCTCCGRACWPFNFCEDCSECALSNYTKKFCREDEDDE